MQSTSRADNEIEHGRFLAEAGAEDVWGWGTPAGKVRAKRRADFIAGGAKLVPGMNVLEVGCGTGNFTEMLTATGANIVAVDISPELLAMAEKRNLPADRVKFVAARFEDCDLHGPFDAIVGSSVLHHLEFRVAIQRIYDMLKPGGVMSFAEPNMLNPQVATQKNIPAIKRRLGDSPDETAFVRYKLGKLLKQIGFVDVWIKPFDWLHPSTPRPLIPVVSAFGRVIEVIPGLRDFPARCTSAVANGCDHCPGRRRKIML